ncbi:hypothetical protein B1VFA_091 [Rhizobium phage B1VFA]|nr:hypothetical protein B1VFA_091 [Rhizobium phage B1VFA]
MASFLSSIVGLMAGVAAATMVAAPVDVDPDRYMFFATRNRVPTGTLVTAAAGHNYVTSKIVVNTPEYPVNHLRIHFSNFLLTEGGNSPREQATGAIQTNAKVIDKVFAFANGELVQVKFGGAPGVTIATAAKGVWSDEIVFTNKVTSDTKVTFFTIYHTAVGEKQIPVYRIQKHRGERVWSGADLATVEAYVTNPDADSVGPLDVSYASQSQPQVYGPDFMVAKGWDGRPVACCFVDSIGEARQEFSAAADDRGNLGWLRRWLDKKAGIGRIPHMMMAGPGAHAEYEMTGTGSNIATTRWDIVDEVKAMNGGTKLPFTVFVNQMGQNDTGTTIAQWWTRIFNPRTRSNTRYPGIRHVYVPPLGRTTTNNNWRDAAGQSFSANNVWPANEADSATGKWVMRARILALFGGICDAAIDTYSAWASPSADGKWPGYLELPFSTLTQPLNATASITVADGSIYTPEQVILVGNTNKIIAAVNDNVITFTSATAEVQPVGTPIYQIPTVDGVHPYSVMVRRIVAGIPQSEKQKLVA